MENEIIKAETTNEISNVGVGGMPVTFGQKMTMAKYLCASGLLPTGLNTPEKVAVALQWGYELGLSPMVAVNNIAVVNGKPTMSIDMLHAIARRSPEYAGCKWVVQDEHRAECIIYRKTATYTEEVRGIYTEEMAQAAGLLGKDNWKKYKARMLKHRALGYGLRDAFPDVLAGIYQPEEMEDTPRETVRNITPVEETKKADTTAIASAKVSPATPKAAKETVLVSANDAETLADKALKEAKPSKPAKDNRPKIKLYTKEQANELGEILTATYEKDGSNIFTDEEKNAFRNALINGEYEQAKADALSLLASRTSNDATDVEVTEVSPAENDGANGAFELF